MAEFLLEILAEEIPAGTLPAARADLLERVARALADERIGGTFFVHSTPRRLILTGEDLPDRQEDRTVEVTGPPASAAFDKEGKPTKAAIGFAKSQGIEVEALSVEETPRGKYVVARKLSEGRFAQEVIAEILPPLVEKMTFPKMMRWGDGKPLWVRPVHSVIALFDGVVVPFTLFGVETSRTTTGHRTLAPARIVVTGVADYFTKLRNAYVEPDAAVRREALAAQAAELATEVGGVPASDPGLVESWSHLVEWPGLVRGAFEEAYLELPEEILVTSMREHQKMLPVRGEGGAIKNAFLAVCDQASDPKGFIAQGNEWVLDARFADARFFYQEDRKQKLEDRLEKLGRLQFQEKLGSYLAKTRRIEKLAGLLAARLGLAGAEADAVRAAGLLKADLVTDMVREFTDLQGIVGGLYAKGEGEPDAVWQAIYDQYHPASADDSVPRTDAGGLAALADRLDTLTGLFGLGLVPTGSKDPYALRRAALGAVKILLDKGWRLDLPAACAEALTLHDALPRTAGETLRDLDAFLLERARFLLEKRGFAADEVESVLSTDARDVFDVADRVAAMAEVRKKEDFVPLATAFKRVQNILAQAGDPGGEVDPALVTEDAERALAADYFQARGMLDDLIGRRHWGEALAVMASLGPPLDRFFTEVMVMAEDQAVRRNRLALLKAMRDQFFRVARFSEIQA
jgi:glycyl-tRNA synthetase beta chain